MAKKTPCQTPGAFFGTHISKDSVGVGVSVPFKLKLSKDEAKVLEANIHNAMELVLAPYFRGK